MGTNYYLIYGKEENVNTVAILRPVDELHIGKSSAGWAFALRVYPEKDINGLDDWMKLFCRTDAKIYDEYERAVPEEEMLSIITNRQIHWKKPLLHHESHGESRCVSPPGADYDLMFYEFC